jgi:Pilus formation protein N terminal region
MRRPVFLGIAFALLSAAPALAGGLSVPMDEVRMVTFVRPVSTVYVGNPMIADVTVIDSRHVFVLGKAFGATNIIALDGGGREVANTPLTVFGRKSNVVTLNLGGQQVTYACAASRCEAAPLPGDDNTVYTTEMTQIGTHQAGSQKAASAAH